MMNKIFGKKQPKNTDKSADGEKGEAGLNEDEWTHLTQNDSDEE